MKTLETPPVLIVSFRRPDTTRRVLNAVRAAKPKRLFFGSDGPRADRPADAEKVAEVRKLVQEVDWDCQITCLFQKRNVGGMVAPTSAMTSFFEQVGEGIVLEDDCLPDPSFFSYCAELLERYRHDTRVMIISGDNFNFGKKIGDGSYYFSQFPICWGWASWRRAWKMHDLYMGSYPEFKKRRFIDSLIADRHIRRRYERIFEAQFSKKALAWDYPWCYTIVVNRGLCICPNVNLVSNIGFGGDSDTCFSTNSIFSNVPTEPMTEIVHPRLLLYSQEVDKAVFYRFHPPRLLYLMSEIVRRIMPGRFYRWCVETYQFLYRLLHPSVRRPPSR